MNRAHPARPRRERIMAFLSPDVVHSGAVGYRHGARPGKHATGHVVVSGDLGIFVKGNEVFHVKKRAHPINTTRHNSPLFALLLACPILLLLSGCSTLPGNPDARHPPPQGTLHPSHATSAATLHRLLGPRGMATLHRVKSRLENASGLKTDMVILKAWRPNAFAWEEGATLKFGINVGMLALLEGQEDQLAFVMSHELAHHAASHIQQSQERSLQVDRMSSVIGIAMSFTGIPLGDTVSLIGGLFVKRQYSRDAELEADRHALRIMANAGYDPRAAVIFHEKLNQLPQDTLALPFFSTHPSGQERITQIQTLLQEMNFTY